MRSKSNLGMGFSSFGGGGSPKSWAAAGLFNFENLQKDYVCLQVITTFLCNGSKLLPNLALATLYKNCCSRLEFYATLVTMVAKTIYCNNL